MAERIEKLKAAGLTEFTEKGPGNVVLNTPEGQHVNLFKLGMLGMREKRGSDGACPSFR